MADGYDGLSEKERETLRLILHGHDAKSMAAALGLSVHTVNERLRNARRKLDVTSSKEAAAAVRARERGPPIPWSQDVGDAGGGTGADGQDRTRISRAAIIAGVMLMSVILAALALGLVPTAADSPVITVQTEEGEAEAAARQWLELGDSGDIEAAYALTATNFREANTLEMWTGAAIQVRVLLGAVRSRHMISAQMPPTPQGYVVVKYRTDFANRAGVVETLSLIHI